MNNVKNDIKLLNNGILPPSFNFNSQENLNKNFDIEKIKYNSFRRVFVRRFENLQLLPGFDDIIDAMNDESMSPNDEINERKKIKTNV